LHLRKILWIPPGNGKTRIAINLMQKCNAENLLVVAPLSLHEWWRRELNKQFSAPYRITSYDKDPDWEETFSAIIFDESILLKNRKTKRFQRWKTYLQRTKPQHILLLTGNPIGKYADDLWTQLHLLDPKRFSSYWRWTEEHCYVQRYWGWEVVGNRSSLDKIVDSAYPYILYDENPHNVQIPDFLFHSINVGLSSVTLEFISKLYRDLYLEDAPIANKLTLLLRTMQIVSDPFVLDLALPRDRYRALLKVLEDVEKPVLVFTSFKHNLYHRTVDVQKKFRTEYLTGETKPSERQTIMDRINDRDLEVVFLTPGVGRFGFNAPDCSLVFWDLPIAYDYFYQAIHRVRRLTSTKRSEVFLLHSEVKSDKVLLDLLLRKSKYTLHSVLKQILLEKEVQNVPE